MSTLVKIIRAPEEILARGEDKADSNTVGGYMSADATNYPAGFFPRGLLVAEATISGETGCFAPYLTLDVAGFDGQSTMAEQVVSGVTLSTDTSDYVNGTMSSVLTVASTVAANTVLASEVITDSDWTSSTHLLFWIKSSVATAAGDLQYLISETANCGGSPHTWNVPALKKDTWTLCCVASGSMTALDHIISIGIKYITDLGACVIKLGDCRSMKANSAAGVGVLREEVWFNDKTNTYRNTDGAAGYEAKVMNHGEFVVAKLIGYDSDFKTDVGGVLSEVDSVLSF